MFREYACIWDDDQDGHGAGAEEGDGRSGGVDDLDHFFDEWEEDENDDDDENPGPDDEAGADVPGPDDQPSGDIGDMGVVGESQPPNEKENQVVTAGDDDHDAESEHGKTYGDGGAERPVARPLAASINKQLDFDDIAIASDDDDVIMLDDGPTSTSLASSSAGPTPCERAAHIRKLLGVLQNKLDTLPTQSLFEFH